jgi:hypothetical protein
MSWTPKPLPLEGEIAWIVISGFLFVIPACLYGYGLHFRNWKECVDPVFWAGMFAYGIWSGIVVSRRNRQERIQREKGLESGNKG